MRLPGPRLAIGLSVALLGWGCGPTAADAASTSDEPAAARAAADIADAPRYGTLFAAIPEGPPELADNPASPARVELGKMLFFEPRLSSSWLISCNTCHNLGLAGVDLMETSVWRSKAKGPVARAIEAFEATLVTPGAPFDRFLAGDTGALAHGERRGLDHFVEKGCASCHNGINLGGQAYFPFGVVARPGSDILPPGDRGRYQVTSTVADEYVFRAPALRNVDLTPPYFHSGGVWDLEEAVAVMSASQLGTELTGDEVDAITAFLRTLTGRQPVVEYPILPPSGEATPAPDPSVAPAATHD